MEDEAEYSLENHADTEGVEETVLLDQANTGPVIHRGPVLFRGQSAGLVIHHSYEEDPVNDEATVADGVVEVREDPERASTAEIKITTVNVAEMLSRGELGIDPSEHVRA